MPSVATGERKHRGFKHEKTDETPMKHEARVFEITSPTKEN